MSHENVLPAAVKRQIEQADAILAELNKPAPTSASEPATPAPAAPATPAPTTPSPAPTPASEPDTFEQRFKVLQGKYNAEVPRLHRALKEEQGKNAELRQRLTNVETLVAALKQKQGTPATPAQPAVSQDEIDQFGADLIDVIRRTARQETGAVLETHLKPVQDSVAHVKETLDNKAKTEAELARERLFEALFNWDAEWVVQNGQPEFMDWLDKKDPITGEVRKTLLGRAYEANDSSRVIAIFEGFRKENAVVNQDPKPAAPVVPETPAPQEGQPSLEELVAPGTPKTGPTGAHEESGKRIWTQKEIDRFYFERNEFIKKNPEKDIPERLVKLERDLFKAQLEGRIR